MPMSSPDPAFDDPYLWLEEVTGERALAWVRERNAETVADLAVGERFEAMRSGIRQVLDSAEKLPGLHWRGEHLYNFWQDEAHPRGLWRRTTVDGVRTDTWEVLLDVDALGAAEGENWVWAGAEGLAPDFRRYLIRLSRGGADATVVREFDLETGFVPDGFTVPEAKSNVSWIDMDHIFVGTDFGDAGEPNGRHSGEGSMTTSGYPRIGKRWRRGTPLTEAVTVFEGETDDVAVVVAHDRTPGFERDLATRRVAFFDAQVYVLGPHDELILIDTPTDANVDVQRQWLLVSPRTPWSVGTTTYPAGCLLAAPLDDYLAGSRELTVLFEPAADVILEYWQWTQTHLLLGLLRNVHSELVVLDPDRQWAHTPLPGLPEAGYTTVSDTNPDYTDEILITTTGFTTPSAMRYGTVRAELTVLREEPTFFDATGVEVQQYWATSADGTRVPYFHVAGMGDGTHAAGGVRRL
jgi:prolyl oligopeptidase